MQEVLGSVIQGALVFPDPAVGCLSLSLLSYFIVVHLKLQVQKVCFGILKNLVEAWGERMLACHMILCV